MATLTRRLRYVLFALNGYVGRSVSLDSPHKLTVLITYYHPARMENMEVQLRNILKCNFVDKLVVSNHNPDVFIDDKVQIKDRRLSFLNQEVRRGCGYRWSVANQLDSEYLVVIDDDMFLFPSQLAKLFRHLIDKPDVPHGLAGMIHLENDELEYHEMENMAVDFLCETYAVTRKHVRRYVELNQLVAKNDRLSEMIATAADFMVISQTGSHNPEIHNVGRLFKSQTFKQAGIAVHKGDGFDASLSEVGRALNNVIVQGRA